MTYYYITNNNMTVEVEVITPFYSDTIANFAITIESPTATCNKKGVSKHTRKLLRKMGR